MNKKKLDKIWENATRPDLETLDGKYRVDIVSGLGYLPARPIRSWTKTIFTSWQQDSWCRDTGGYNRIEQEEMGYFTVCVNFEKKWIELLYDAPPNILMWRRLKDHVRRIDNKTLIGKIYLRVWGKYRFAGYFTLTKQEVETCRN